MYDTDFGRVLRATPRIVARVRDQASVSRHLADANRQGLSVTVRGAGHSCHGQTLSEDGLLLVNVPDASPAAITLRGDEAECSARLRWRQVERWLNSHGRSVPVLPDYLDLSVGGTLSVGGYGMDSVRLGAQVDQVRRLRLTMPDGTAVWCSPEEQTELFAWALGGLGQVGVLDRVVLRTVPHARFTSLFTFQHASVADLVQALEPVVSGQMADAPPLCKALASHGRFTLTVGVGSSTWREALAARLPEAVRDVRRPQRLVVPKHRSLRSFAVRQWLWRFPRHHRLWCDYLLDYEGLRSFEALLRPLVEGDAFRGCLQSIYIAPIRRLPRPTGFPLEAMGLTGAPMMFGIGLYSFVPTSRPDVLAAVDDVLARCLDACLERGGRPYLYGWHRMDEERCRVVYGPAFDRLLDLKRRIDPFGRFQSTTFRRRTLTPDART